MSTQNEGFYILLASIFAASFCFLSVGYNNQKKIISSLEKEKPIYFDKNVMGDPSKNEAFYVIGKDTAYTKIDGKNIEDYLKR